jgi:hypothetical protein
MIEVMVVMMETRRTAQLAPARKKTKMVGTPVMRRHRIGGWKGRNRRQDQQNAGLSSCRIWYYFTFCGLYWNREE